MPCSQMISMNISPPRLRAARKLAKTPAGEGADLEQLQPEHRLGHLGLDDAEGDQQDSTPTTRRADDHRVRPAHGVVAVGLDAVGDAHHDQDEPDGEGDVAGPIDRAGRRWPSLTQFEVAQDRAEQADGHRHQEDEPPVDGGQDPAQDQPDEGSAEGGGLVDPQGHAPLVVGEGIGEDGRRVGHEHGRSHALEDPHGDQPDPGRVTGHPGDAEQQREEREHGETEVVGPDPPVDVAQPTEAHHQDAGDHQKAEDHPQQVEGVAGLQADRARCLGRCPGRAMSTIEPSMVAISMPRVEMNRADPLVVGAGIGSEGARSRPGEPVAPACLARCPSAINHPIRILR